MDPVFGVESPAFVAIRAVLSASTIGLLGALTLRWAVVGRYVGPDQEAVRAAVDARLPRWIDCLGLVAVAATLARLVAQHVAVFGAEQALSRESLGTLLFRSGWGRSWWLAIVAAVMVTWVAPRLRQRTRPAWFGAAAATLLLAVSQPLSGHPAAAAMPRLAVATQALHLLGAGGWVGSLTLLTFVAIPAARRIGRTVGGVGDDGAVQGEITAPDARVAGLVRAFSPTALAFSALLAITGLITAWGNLGGFAPLWQSAYGRTLVLKLSFLGVTVATGAYNWRRVLPRLGQPESNARLRRSSLVELGAALLVLTATAVLVATPMPGE